MIVDIIQYAWQVGGGLAEIPYRYNAVNVTAEDVKNASIQEKNKLTRIRKTLKETHALRCEFGLRLNIAVAFSKCARIYFPHNVDFRGRTYPLPPHLNHMGPDICRGLFQYADTKELGERGLFWLKVHLANKIGKDKLSLKDRVKYVEDNLTWIRACAQNPYENIDWMDCDSPWQSLAAMIELTNALRVILP
jgi:DNA-directed RNA polymerase